jgi:bisphosphoglycerate-independent phosphoglycerate mutase (AlkP superfamily)
MTKEQVLEMLREALTKLNEVQDIIVQVELYAMDQDEHWYAGRAEIAGEHLYRAQKEIEELFGLEVDLK